MLSDQELLSLLAQRNLPLAGRQIIDKIRASDPARRTGGGTHNVAARFASRKMGVVIQAESHKNELPALYIWEYDPATHEFYDQPPSVKLSYRTAGGRRATHYSTPDFFVIQDDWIGWVECKTEEWLAAAHASGNERFQPDANGGWRCPAGEAYAAQYGLGFKIRSSKENNWILVRNLEFLADYFAPSCAPLSVEDAQALATVWEGDRWMLLRDLLARATVSADIVYKSIADGILCVDLAKEPLSERNYTTAYRDVESAKIHGYQKSDQVDMPAIAIPKLALLPQAIVTWDGRPWRIVNVGVKDIFLLNDGGSGNDLVSLDRDTFQSLVTLGKIVGLQADDHRELLAERLVKQAAEIDLVGGVKRLAALDAAAVGVQCLPIPPRTLRHWKACAAQGAAAIGNRFVGVITRVSHRGNRNRKLPQDAIDAMNSVIDSKVLVDSKPNILGCYGALVNDCLARSLACPSEKTFRGEIKKRRLDLRIVAREGRKAAYPISEYQWRIDQSTPRHGERPFEVGHIDHTEVDAEMVDSETGENLGRPWLTVLFDAFTRMVLAFFLSFDPPSYRSCMAVIRECVRRHGRIPRTIVVDKGSEFEGTFFEVLLARLECHKKSRPAAKARFGSVIERFFGIANQTFFHNLAGNSQALQRPRSMSPTHDPRKLAVWTLSALNDRFEDYADNHYGNWRHSALGISPNEAMARGLAATGNREHLLIPFSSEFKFLCLPSTSNGTALVHSGHGLSINRIDYWHPAFRDLGGKKLPVRYDPFDVSIAYALVRGEWVQCWSQFRAQLERRSEREIKMITQEIRIRHAQKSIHRRIRASDIATFLDGTYETEELLRQQRRDAQRNCDAVVEPPQPEAIVLQENVQEHGTPWSEVIELEIFGELK